MRRRSPSEISPFVAQPQGIISELRQKNQPKLIDKAVALSEVPVSKGARAMYVTVTQPLTFEEFLAWNDGSGREFELLDGIPVPLSEPAMDVFLFFRIKLPCFIYEGMGVTKAQKPV